MLKRAWYDPLHGSESALDKVSQAAPSLHASRAYRTCTEAHIACHLTTVPNLISARSPRHLTAIPTPPHY
eukprot:365983-Chlamydomonas_euryale.AAC.10